MGSWGSDWYPLVMKISVTSWLMEACRCSSKRRKRSMVQRTGQNYDSEGAPRVGTRGEMSQGVPGRLLGL